MPLLGTSSAKASTPSLSTSQGVTTGIGLAPSPTLSLTKSKGATVNIIQPESGLKWAVLAAIGAISIFFFRRK